MASKADVVEIGTIDMYEKSTEGQPFAPGRGVIVSDYGGLGIVATSSAVVYQSLIEESIEELSGMTTESIAATLETSMVYAAAIKGRIMSTLKSHADILSKSYEAVIGVVTDGNGNTFAIGRRSVSPAKVSKMTRLRRSLPVGALAMYRLQNTATMHRTSSSWEVKNPYSNGVKSAKVGKLYVKPRQRVVIISDGEHFRRYAGRTFLAGTKMWDLWDATGAFEDVPFLFVSGDNTRVYSKQDLVDSKPADIYPELSAHTPNFSSVPKALEPIVEMNPGGIDLTIYFTDWADGISDLTTYIRSLILEGYPIRVGTMRFGGNAYSQQRSFMWKVRSGFNTEIANDIRADFRSRRVKFMIPNVIAQFVTTSVGVRVMNHKVLKYIALTEGMTFADVAKAIGVGTESLMVAPSKETSQPYMHNMGGVLMMSASPVMPNGTFAATVQDESRPIAKGEEIYAIDGDLTMLLANA